MYHSFLIHLSADGHLGCFHVLAIINRAVMNIGVHVSLSDLVSSVDSTSKPMLLLVGIYPQWFSGLSFTTVVLGSPGPWQQNPSMLLWSVTIWGVPGGAVVKNLPTHAGDAGDAGSIPGLGRPPGENDNPPQYSCLENPMARGALLATDWGHKESDRTEHVLTCPRKHTYQSSLSPICTQSLWALFKCFKICIYMAASGLSCGTQDLSLGHRLFSCGTPAQLPLGTWDLQGPESNPRPLLWQVDS